MSISRRLAGQDVGLQQHDDALRRAISEGMYPIRARSNKITVHLFAIVLGLYLTVPFYKPALQSYIPVDMTILLATLCILISMPTALKTISGSRNVGEKHVAFVSSWLLLAAVYVMGLLNSGSGSLPVQTTLRLFATVLLPLLIILPVVNSGPRSISQVFDLLFGVGAIVTFVGVPFLLISSAVARNTALGSNPINVATAAMLVPAIGATYVWRKSVLHKLMVLGITPLSLFVSLSAARGPVVATAIAFFVVMLLRSRASAIWGVILGGSFLAVLPSVSASIERLLPRFAAERFAALGDIISAIRGSDSSLADSSDLVRLELYRIAGDMFKQSPILGNGTDSFRAVTATIPPLSDLTHPHNLPLLFASEYGLIGLAVFALIIALVIRSLLRNMHSYLGVTLGLLFFSTLIEANLSGGMDNRLFWGITFLALALPVDERRDPASSNVPNTEAAL